MSNSTIKFLYTRLIQGILEPYGFASLPGNTSEMAFNQKLVEIVDNYHEMIQIFRDSDQTTAEGDAVQMELQMAGIFANEILKIYPNADVSGADMLVVGEVPGDCQVTFHKNRLGQEIVVIHNSDNSVWIYND